MVALPARLGDRLTSRRPLPPILRSNLFKRIVVAGSVVGAILGGLWTAGTTGLIDPILWNLLQRAFSEGAINTLTFSIFVIPLGAILGFLIGWSRVSRHPILSWPAVVYIDIIRGIPPIVMILFAFFWLPTLIRVPGVTGVFFALWALVIHTSAYQAEIFRAGFQSVPRAQIDAAESLGLSRWQGMRYVVLPQTFRVVLPALGNEFAVVIKDTSLLAAIGAAELVFWGRNISQFTAFEFGAVEWALIIWLVVALLYFVVTYVIVQIVGAVEGAFRVPGLGSAAF